MQRTVLASLVLLATAVPASGQVALGVRAGVGNAWMGSASIFGGGSYDPCPPDMDCPDAAESSIRAFTFGTDLDIPISDSSGVFGIRIGAAYAEKGGTEWVDANEEPVSTISTSYLQFSVLLRARTSGRPQSVVALAGPWVATQLSCEKEGNLAARCARFDAGIAVGAGVEIDLPGGGSSVGLEGIYYRGLLEHSGLGEATRFLGVQLGFTFVIG